VTAAKTGSSQKESLRAGDGAPSAAEESHEEPLPADTEPGTGPHPVVPGVPGESAGPGGRPGVPGPGPGARLLHVDTSVSLADLEFDLDQLMQEEGLAGAAARL